MDKLEITGLNLGRVITIDMGAQIHTDKYLHIIKTAYLIVEKLAQTSFRYSPVSFRAVRQTKKLLKYLYSLQLPQLIVTICLAHDTWQFM
jgi:hypothetical protein